MFCQRCYRKGRLAVPKIRKIGTSGWADTGADPEPRQSQWRNEDPQLAQLVEAYEEEHRKWGYIDFDDMPLLAVPALGQHKWLQQALLAKYPILIVDEYQDLGRLCTEWSWAFALAAGCGFLLSATWTVDLWVHWCSPRVAAQLAERDDVETVRLRLNYRCGSRIVTASSYALGEDRDYSAPEGAPEGTIYFNPLNGSYQQHAE